MGYTRQKAVDTICSWEGKKESDGSYKSIIDLYNTLAKLGIAFPRGIKMQYGWAWCACTWSAVAIKNKATNIIPIEISCYYLIEAAKKMGVWHEADNYVPKPGDAVLYDWQDNGVGDNKGTPDHVGMVISVNKSAGYFVVMEGNYSDSVKRRTVLINGRYIRGFITPKYDEGEVKEPEQKSGKSIKTIALEVINGLWGSGDARKKALEAKGYDYKKVQAKVNEILNGSATTPKTNEQDQKQPSEKKVTAGEVAKCFDKKLSGTYKVDAKPYLYLRTGAGTNKKALVKIPNGTKVQNYGYYNVSNGAKWLYIQVIIDGVSYTGYSHSNYLTKVK